MKKSICLILIATIFFSGCGGRNANPVPVYLPGDENLSCEALKAEIVQLQSDMVEIYPKTDKGLTNALWIAGGLFSFGAGFLFVDIKDAEKIEFNAMRKRHNRLLMYAAERDCDMSDVRAENIPSLTYQKKEAKKVIGELTKETGQAIPAEEDLKGQEE